MVESPPSSGALWLTNYVVEKGLSVRATNEQANYPGSNILSPHRSDRWRSVNGDSDVSVAVEMSEVVSPTCVALIDTNFQTGSATHFQFAGADDSNITTNVVLWNLPLYDVENPGVLRYYLGAPTTGTLGSGRRFWRVLFSNTTWGDYTTDAYIQLGGLWFGTHEVVTPTNARHAPRNASAVAKAYGGAKWVDTLTTYDEIDVDLDFLTFAEYYALKAKLRTQKMKHCLLDLHANPGNNVVKAGSAYYGLLSNRPYSGDVTSPVGNTLSLSFEEANG